MKSELEESSRVLLEKQDDESMANAEKMIAKAVQDEVGKFSVCGDAKRLTRKLLSAEKANASPAAPPAAD